MLCAVNGRASGWREEIELRSSTYWRRFQFTRSQIKAAFTTVVGNSGFAYCCSPYFFKIWLFDVIFVEWQDSLAVESAWTIAREEIVSVSEAAILVSVQCWDRDGRSTSCDEIPAIVLICWLLWHHTSWIGVWIWQQLTRGGWLDPLFSWFVSKKFPQVRIYSWI